MSKKGAKFVSCKCTGTVRVVTHTTVWWKVLTEFLHNLYSQEFFLTVKDLVRRLPCGVASYSKFGTKEKSLTDK